MIYICTNLETEIGGLECLFSPTVPYLSFRSSQVHVKPGDEVTRGSILMTVEGMKMEVSF